jgi:hypothetical protein
MHGAEYYDNDSDGKVLSTNKQSIGNFCLKQTHQKGEKNRKKLRHELSC